MSDSLATIANFESFSTPSGHVRFTPESDRLLRRHEMTLCAISDRSASQQNGPLFDHPVGACKQRRRDGDTEHPRSRSIDD